MAKFPTLEFSLPVEKDTFKEVPILDGDGNPVIIDGVELMKSVFDKKIPVQGWENRDVGKVYLIDEANPFVSFNWGARMAFALGDSLPDGLPQSITGIGAWVMQAGMNAFKGGNQAEIIPLLDELFNCVKFKTPSGVNMQIKPHEDHGFIEEISTVLILQFEVLKYHAGFYRVESH